MTTKVSDKTGFFDTRSTGYRFGIDGGLLGQLIGSVKDTCQGACAGFLGLLGTLHMSSESSGVSTLSSQIPFLDMLWASISANGLAGPIELLGGLALFLTARRVVSRMVGLLGFIAFIAAYAQGYSIGDMVLGLSAWLETASVALQSLPIAQSSAQSG